LAKITGWGHREILEELPFSTGLQLLHADDYQQGHRREWKYSRRAADVDAIALMETAWQKLNSTH
jgi:hypothetical protein